jgi:hypothetical protein
VSEQDESALHESEQDEVHVKPHAAPALHEAEQEGPSHSMLHAPPLQLTLPELPAVTLHELFVHSMLPLVPAVTPHVD